MNDNSGSVKSAGRLKDKTLFDYLFVLVLIIYGGLASTFVRTFGTEKPLAILIPVALSGIMVLRYKVVFNKQIFLLILFFVLYHFALYIKYQSIYPILFGQLLVNFLVTYITVKALKFSFFLIYEYLLTWLAAIALFMWIIQLGLGGDNLLDLAGSIPSINTFSAVTGGGINIIIYSIQPYAQVIASNSAFARNCGFAWEPGGFAVFLNIALFIKIFYTSSEKKFNTRFWILLLALLSSQSTTGYVIFILIMIFYLLQKNIKYILLLFPVLILLITLMISLPFMREKIVQNFKEASQVDILVEESIGRESAVGPQRFASFVIAFRDFMDNPLFGYGGEGEERWFRKINSNIVPISGIGNLLAQYGLSGFIFFIAILTGSSRAFARNFNFKGEYLFFLIMIMITISYSVIFVPVIMSFWMFSLFEKSSPAEEAYNEFTGEQITKEQL